MYGEGISREGEVLEMATNQDIINKSGAWYDYNGERIGQGKDNIKKYLKENPKVFEEILGKLKEKLGMKK
jgi:recombination protein RecA